jgi:hypothetical protein
MEVSGQLHTPAIFLPAKGSVVTTEYEKGWISEPVWTVFRKISCPFKESNHGYSLVQSLLHLLSYTILASHTADDTCSNQCALKC